MDERQQVVNSISESLLTLAQAIQQWPSLETKGDNQDGPQDAEKWVLLSPDPRVWW
jgi:hypothetical protein